MLSNLTTYQKLLLLKKTAGGGVKIVTKTLKGNAPLTFTAVARPLVSLIQYGKIEQAATPTPAAPVDIVCNNGALKMRHRSGLPNGYKLLEYIGGSGSQYVITDVYLASTDVVECEFRNSTTTGYGAVYGVFKLGESSALYGNQTYYGYNAANDKVNTEIRINTDWHSSRHDFVNGTLTVDDTTVTFTPFEFANTEKNAVLSRYYNNSYGYNWKGYIRKFKVTRGGEVICDLLPAKDSNDVAGLYDLISGNFYTATGGTLLEGDVVDDYELYVDGTPETLTVSGINLLNPSTSNIVIGENYQVNGNPGVSRNNWRTGLIPIEGGKTYAFWGRKKSDNSISAFNRINWFDADGNNILPRPSYTVDTVTVATSPSNAAFVGLSCSCFNSTTAITRETFDEFDWMFAEANAEIPYQPYTTPQTASAQNLYQVGDYKDEQDIISGAITRRVGVKVLTGEETMNYASGTLLLSLNNIITTGRGLNRLLCTHYRERTSGDYFAHHNYSNNYVYFYNVDITSLEDWRTFFADQYAAGTPVIVLYPLAEEQTETVSPQALSTGQGVNTIKVDAEVSPIELEVSYKDKQ